MNLERFINYALKNGATEVEIVRNHIITKTSKVLVDKFIHTSSIYFETVIRVVVGKSVASVRISSNDEKILLEAVDKAIIIAKNSPKDPYWESLPTSEKIIKKDLKTWNEALSTIDIEELSRRLLYDYKYAKKHQNTVKLVGISYRYRGSYINIVNSNGVVANDKVNGLSFTIETKGRENGYEATTFSYRRSKDPELETKELITETFNRNHELLDAVKYEELYGGPIALDPIATATTLNYSLTRVITGTSVVEGYSPFKDKVGKQIASKNLSIIDDGIRVGYWNTRYYDDEGYPRGTTQILKDGILMRFLHNSYTANRLDEKNTGNAVRIGTTVTTGITNFIVEGREVDTEKLLSSYDEIILVKNMPMNAHTTNYITGALNLVATEIYYMRKGSVEKIIKPMTLSGNIYDALKTIRLGDDSEETFYNITTPTIVLEGLKMA